MMRSCCAAVRMKKARALMTRAEETSVSTPGFTATRRRAVSPTATPESSVQAPSRGSLSRAAENTCATPSPHLLQILVGDHKNVFKLIALYT